MVNRGEIKMVMEFIEKNFDEYNRKARLAPALIVIFPIVTIPLVLFPNNIWSFGNAIGLLVGFGVLRLLTQLSRNMGKAIEERLYKNWGGKPTTYFLRHRTSPNKVQLARWHNNLNKLTGEKMPSLNEEESDPDSADQIYDVCIRSLIRRTRDNKKFSLLYEENCNYGFLRNLLGMKSLGLITSFLSFLILGLYCAFVIGLTDIANWQSSNLFQSLKFTNCSPIALTFLGINFLIFIVLLLFITPNLVKGAADAYAARLLESCEKLLLDEF
jgi:hypothetical protein